MRAALPLLPALAVLLAPGVVDAGGSGASSCNCTPPPACCNVPSTHTISIPGVNVTAPSVSVGGSSLWGGVGSGSGPYGGSGPSSSSGASGASSSAGASVASDVSLSVQASGSASSSASLLASAASTASALGSGSALATANSQAANLLAASGGGGAFTVSEGVSGGSIPNLTVTTPGAAPSREVCARTATRVQAVAVQAVCLDDKDVPHPASQVMPGQDVPEGWSGELFRCIAGAHMQYVTAPWAGAARFDHGQTVVCAKGEALWRDAGGRLQCRPQTPARDCNERSLLRRYGAGIKVLKAPVSGQCVEWRTESVQADAASQGALQLDGGVGG